MRRIGLHGCVLVAMALACAAMAIAHAQDGEDAARPIPEELQPAVAAAERTGRLLQRLDRAAWIATDALQADVQESELHKAIGGWITEARDTGTRVLFFDRSDPASPLYLVDVESSGRTSHARGDTGAPLTEPQRSLIRARQSAFHQQFLACSPNYNSVVIPRDDAIYVYLMPGTTKQGVHPAGGHHLFVYDTSGRTLRSQRAFTKGCIDLGGGTEDKTPAAMMVSHLLDRQPTEIHVFISLNAGVPLYVGTTENRYLWKVDNGTISLVNADERSDPAAHRDLE